MGLAFVSAGFHFQKKVFFITDYVISFCLQLFLLSKVIFFMNFNFYLSGMFVIQIAVNVVLASPLKA